MTGQKCLLTGHFFTSPVILTGHIITWICSINVHKPPWMMEKYSNVLYVIPMKCLTIIMLINYSLLSCHPMWLLTSWIKTMIYRNKFLILCFTVSVSITGQNKLTGHFDRRPISRYIEPWELTLVTNSGNVEFADIINTYNLEWFLLCQTKWLCLWFIYHRRSCKSLMSC